MFAARAQHLETKILPALERDVWVVCDRFTGATYAYQVVVAASPVLGFRHWKAGPRRAVPDLTLFFDIPVKVGLERADRRGAPDQLSPGYRVLRAGAENLSGDNNPRFNRVITLDATVDVESLFREW